MAGWLLGPTGHHHARSDPYASRGRGQGEVVLATRVSPGSDRDEPVQQESVPGAREGAMSRLGETQRAYGQLVKLLDQEIRRRRGSSKELERFRETLDLAFYLLGWSQFEYLVTREAGEFVKEKAKLRTVERYA